jgi:hypothetical protein
MIPWLIHEIAGDTIRSVTRPSDGLRAVVSPWSHQHHNDAFILQLGETTSCYTRDLASCEDIVSRWLLHGQDGTQGIPTGSEVEG